MALVLKDRVKVTTTTTGTGAFAIGGAQFGFQGFSTFANGDTTYYTVVDHATGAWETGVGTYSSTGPTLARTTVLDSSNAGGLVDFGVGPKDLFVVYPAGSAVSTAGNVTLIGNLNVPSINGGQLAGMRNKIINGNFNIAQRGASGTSANTYCLDRWISFHAGTAHTWSQVAGGALAGVYFSSLLQIAGAAGNTGATIVQRIESLNSADLTGRTVTFSAYVLHTGTGDARNVTITTKRPNAADNWSGVATIANSGGISVPLNTWTRITWTTTLPGSGPNLGLSFELGLGAVTAGQQFFFTGVQLEVGEVATPFEHRPIGTELALCERYYQAGVTHTVNGSMPNALWHTLQVAMRAAPTITATLTAGSGTGYVTYSMTPYGFRYLSNGVAGVADFSITASAEL